VVKPERMVVMEVVGEGAALEAGALISCLRLALLLERVAAAEAEEERAGKVAAEG